MEYTINTVSGGDIVIIDMTGSLVASNVEEFTSRVSTMIEKNFPYILLEMSGVDFIDSAGLGACMAIHKQVSDRSGMIIFSRLSKQVDKIFRITQADKKLNIVSTKPEGIASLSSKMMESRGK